MIHGQCYMNRSKLSVNCIYDKRLFYIFMHIKLLLNEMGEKKIT